MQSLARVSTYLGAHLYIAFLDEFGHIGPFISRSHRKYKQSPVFGLAGYVLPHRNARTFATWFYQMKAELLQPEISILKVHQATWEKKGNELFTSKNIKNIQSLEKQPIELQTKSTN